MALARGASAEDIAGSPFIVFETFAQLPSMPFGSGKTGYTVSLFRDLPKLVPPSRITTTRVRIRNRFRGSNPFSIVRAMLGQEVSKVTTRSETFPPTEGLPFSRGFTGSQGA